MKRFAGCSAGRENNFNLIRILAAVGVLISHSWPIINPHSAEPLDHVLGISLGHVCVLLFFAVSGFFITKSFERTASLSNFLSARIARLFPALIVVIVITVFIVGPLLTNYDLGSYFSNPRIYTYLMRNILICFGQIYELPGVLDDRPINGSLWTLRYELYCYGSVVILGLIKSLSARRYWLWLAFVFLVAIAAGILDKGAGVSRLVLAFALGGGVYVYREKIPFSGLLAFALVLASLTSIGSPLFGVLFCLACAYGVLWVGFVRIPYIIAYNRLGDISYGVYIYAFPVQMIWASEYSISDPHALTLVSLVTTIPLAIGSWLLIEKPALKMRPKTQKIDGLPILDVGV